MLGSQPVNLKTAPAGRLPQISSPIGNLPAHDTFHVQFPARHFGSSPRWLRHYPKEWMDSSVSGIKGEAVTPQDSLPEPNDEAIYASALSEVRSGTPLPGLWAIAFAESDGEQNKAEARYIRLRVQQEKKRRQQEQAATLASAITLAAQAERRKAKELLTVVERLRLKGYEAKRRGVGWTIREPLGGRVRLDSDTSLLKYAEGLVTVDYRLLDNPNDKNGALTLRSMDPYAAQGASPRTQEPAGVGGWLLLLVMLMLVVSPLLSVALTAEGFWSVEERYPALMSVPEYSILKAATWWIMLPCVAALAYGGWGLARGRSRSVVKRAKIILWLVGPVATVAIGIVVRLTVTDNTYARHPEFVAQLIGHLLASTIIAVIWTAYLSKSKRVRNTYGPPE